MASAHDGRLAVAIETGPGIRTGATSIDDVAHYCGRHGQKSLVPPEQREDDKPEWKCCCCLVVVVVASGGQPRVVGLHINSVSAYSRPS
jgi:hypothetical protein